MRSLSITVIVILAHTTVWAQFISTPPVQNGTIAAGEYGFHVDGANQITTGGAIWYCTWDANNLYIALEGSDPTEGAVIYFDIDPVIPVNGQTNSVGSIAWNGNYDRSSFNMPFRADFAIYAKNTYNEIRLSNGSGDWGAAQTTALSVFANTPNSIIEIAVSWNEMTNGNGRPSSFNWFGYKVYDNGDWSNGTYHQFPNDNATLPNNAGPGQVNQVNTNFYFSVINTDDNTSTFPFSAKSFTYHQDDSQPSFGGYYLLDQDLLDLTINDNSPDNSDNDPSNDAYDNQEIANRVLIDGLVVVNRNLVVWEGSALLPADNISGDIHSQLRFNGSNGRIYNLGRIDCNPEAANVGDYNLRRMDIDVKGILTYGSSPLFKDRARFSNITVHEGAELRGPDVGSAEIELQYGTLTVGGTLVFKSSNGALDIGTRGDYVTHNDYFLSSLNGTATIIFDDVLIGRNSSALRALSGGGEVNVHVKGNFSNYGTFEPTAINSQIDLIFNGNQRQEIRGNVNETVGGRTYFHNLTIDNDNGNSDGNLGADVHFVSYGGGAVQYYVSGDLQLVSGDLVSRDRLNPTITHDLIFTNGGLSNLNSGQSEISGTPSSFVDGPMYVRTVQSNDHLFFPVGKGRSHRMVEVTTFAQTFIEDSIRVELFDESSTILGNALPSVPESIQNSSFVHYWNIHTDGPLMSDSIEVHLHYSTQGEDDVVFDATTLRMLKAAEGGGGIWENVSEFTGGTAAGTGSIQSRGITNLSDFTLGSISGNPLPIELLWFDAEKVEGNAHLIWMTASELNNSHFLIERSTDGVEWKELGQISGAGNSSQALTYDWWDTEVEKGYNHYRLTQFDFDGTATIIGVRYLNFEDETISFFPNPFSESAVLHVPMEGASIRIIDAQGRTVFQQNLKEGVNRIEADLDSGGYVALLMRGEEILEVLRLIKEE